MTESLHRTVILILLMTVMGYVRSQEITHFSSDSVLFIGEVKELFKNVTNEKTADIRRMLSDFEDEWTRGMFSERQKEQIYQTANLMLREQLRPYPYFYDYLSTVLHFIKYKLPSAAFDSLHSSLHAFITGPDRRQLNNYLNNLVNVMAGSCLYDANGTTWAFRNSEFTFKVDTLPKFVFSKLDLACYASRDSITIEDARGVYYPTLNIWKGQKGTVTWERAGLDRKTVYAQLGNFTIQLRYSNYSADSVRFIHHGFFKQPLYGRLEDKVMANTNPSNAVFPKFTSYLKRIQIVNVFDHIDYDGGFTMEGSTVIGSGSEDHTAEVIFKKKDQAFIVARSQRFMILDDRILSNHASITIYHEADSIYHPDLQMKYIDGEKEMAFMRWNEGLSLCPFFDTYHDIDMYFEELNWKMNRPVIDFEKIKSINNEGKASFESDNYYREYLFERLKGIDELHPLVIINNFVRHNPTGVYYVEELAAFMQRSVDQARIMVINLASKGFLNYDPNTGAFSARERLFRYINAKSGKTDYDVIQFNSVVNDESNASLNINTFDLTIKGVPLVHLSDSQQVFIYPKGDEIVLKGGMDFTFSGRVHAGLLDFYASDCSFEYDTFRLNMPQVDSLTFSVRSKQSDAYGHYSNIKVKSVIRNLNGTLWIDFPTNKSGLKDYPIYPYFTSKDISYVFYNDPSIGNGVYDSSTFYYEVYPFTFDSLNTFNTDHLEFKGKLIAGGILPDIEYPLKVQDDYSLGFKKKIPASGYPLYGGKGTFYDNVQLSNRGLKGDGTLHYLNSTSHSGDFTFYPDSTTAVLDDFALKEQIAGVEYPAVNASTAKILWRPDANNMMVQSLPPDSLRMYHHQAALTGTLNLTPGGLTGLGKLTIGTADLDSKLFAFNQHIVQADTVSFHLRTADGSQIALSTTTGKSLVDFNVRKGEFRTPGAGSAVQFPLNEFMCYMNEIDWYLDGDDLQLRNTYYTHLADINKLSYRDLIDYDLSGSKFISLNPAQDSLSFVSLKATYNMKNDLLTAEDVKILRVADAAIFPDDGKIVIGRNASVKPIIKATIIADTATKYHSIYNASVNVFSRKKYSARGTYDYYDENGTVQPIQLTTVSVDTAFHTYARGTVPDSVHFTLSHHFDFKGYVTLNALQPFLIFDGGYRIRQDCLTDTLMWVKFTDTINPANILLPVDEELTDINNKMIDNGIIFSLSQQIYPILFRMKERSSDSAIVTSSGFIKYDKTTDRYLIGSTGKMSKTQRSGNLLVLNNQLCTLYGEGRLNMNLDYGEITFNTFGNATNFIIPDSSVFDLVMGIKFFFSDDILDRMAKKLSSDNLTPVNITNDKFLNALSNLLGEEQSKQVINDITYYGNLRKLIQALDYTLFLTDVHMVWNPVSRSYISTGPIGIGSIMDKQIFKYTNGYIELAKRRSGDVLNILLKPAEREWYFFTFSNHIMQFFSSDPDINNALMEIKQKKRTLNLKGTRAEYQYIISTPNKVGEFQSRMQSINQ